MTNVEAAGNAVRDTKNWLAVFKTEYDVADEAMEKLHAKLDEIGSKMSEVTAESAEPAATALTEAKQWLAVFAQEYSLNEETVKVLHEKFDAIGNALAAQ